MRLPQTWIIFFVVFLLGLPLLTGLIFNENGTLLTFNIEAPSSTDIIVESDNSTLIYIVGPKTDALVLHEGATSLGVIPHYDLPTFAYSERLFDFHFLLDEASIRYASVTLQNANGLVRYNQLLNLLSYTNYDISSGTDFSANSIELDPAVLPLFDLPATVTINNLNFTTIRILRDGSTCLDCNLINYAGGTVEFEITGFSTYSVTQGTDVPSITMSMAVNATNTSLNITGLVFNSSYPSDVSLNVGNDTLVEFTHNGELNSSVAMSSFSSAVNNIIANNCACSVCALTNSNLTCTIGMVLNSSTQGNIRLSDLNISQIVRNITRAEDSGSYTWIDLDDFFYDIDNDSNLAFSASSVVNISVNISSGGVVSITPDPDFFGERFVQFIANDSINTSRTNIIFINITSVNDPPVFAALPNISIAEDQANISDLLALDSYISDVDNTSSELTITMLNETDTSLIDCFIDAGNYISCQDLASSTWGNSTLTLQVSDGEYTANATTNVIVGAVNDGPYTTSTLTGPSSCINRYEILTYNLNSYFGDEDSTISYGYSTSSASILGVQIQGSIASVQGLIAGRSATLYFTATDGEYSASTNQITITVCAEDDAPPPPPSTPAPTVVPYAPPIDNDVTRRTSVCVEVESEERTTALLVNPLVITESEDLSLIIPEGYEIIDDPFSLACLDTNFAFTFTVPDSYQNVSLLRCIDGVCLPTRVDETVVQSCGVRIQEVTRKSDYYTNEDFIQRIEQINLSVEDEYELQRDNLNIKFLAAGAASDVKITQPINLSQPANVHLAIVGDPLTIDASEQVSYDVTLDYKSVRNIDEDSIAVYAYEQGRWNYLGGELDKENKQVTISTQSQGSVTLAPMGILCDDCLSTKLERIYQPLEPSETALVLVHGFASNPATFNTLVQDLTALQEKFDIYTFSYPTSKRVDALAIDLNKKMQDDLQGYDQVIVVAHSLGGLVAEQAVYNLHNQNNAFLDKIKKLILISPPNKGSPIVPAMRDFFDELINDPSGDVPLSPNSDSIEDLTVGSLAEKVPGVQYYMIAGKKSLGIDLGFTQITADRFFNNTPNDGFVSLQSATRLGDYVFQDRCVNYWELPLGHLELLEDRSSLKIVERILSEESTSQDIELGRIQYFRSQVDDCREDATYVVVGKPIDARLLYDPALCNCGNGICGIGENELNCPEDCARGILQVGCGFSVVTVILLTLLVFLLGFSNLYINYLVGSKRNYFTSLLTVIATLINAQVILYYAEVCSKIGIFWLYVDIFIFVYFVLVPLIFRRRYVSLSELPEEELQRINEEVREKNLFGKIHHHMNKRKEYKIYLDEKRAILQEQDGLYKNIAKRMLKVKLAKLPNVYKTQGTIKAVRYLRGVLREQSQMRKKLEFISALESPETSLIDYDKLSSARDYKLQSLNTMLSMQDKKLERVSRLISKAELDMPRKERRKVMKEVDGMLLASSTHLKKLNRNIQDINRQMRKIGKDAKQTTKQPKQSNQSKAATTKKKTTRAKKKNANTKKKKTVKKKASANKKARKTATRKNKTKKTSRTRSRK